MHPTRNTLPEDIRAQSIELLNKHLAATQTPPTCSPKSRAASTSSCGSSSPMPRQSEQDRRRSE